MSRDGQPRPPDHGRAVARLLLPVVLLTAVAWNLIGNLALPGAWYVPANLVLAAALVAMARKCGLSWDELGLGPQTVLRGLALGLTAAAVVAAGLAVSLAVPAGEAALASGAPRDASTFDRWFVPLVRIPLGTALFEEVLFRGVLLAALLRRHRARTAVVAGSMAFGLWHIVPAWETARGSPTAVVAAVAGTVVVTTLAGLVFAALRLWARSLAAPVLAHTATNSLGYLAALAAARAAG